MCFKWDVPCKFAQHFLEMNEDVQNYSTNCFCRISKMISCEHGQACWEVMERMDGQRSKTQRAIYIYSGCLGNSSAEL